MLYYSNAKINLGLNITEKRPDGFHNIETVFYPISVSDAIEFIPNKSTSIDYSGLLLDCEAEDNLIVKAYRLLENDFDLPEIAFHLHKVIPFGAGLGGGSANAAYTLVALNRYFNLNISSEKFIDYAMRLGSDCAFFIENKAVFANQKGEHFRNIDLDLSKYHILLIHPGFGISTPEAYASIIPARPGKSVEKIIKQPIETWKEELQNDFEKALLPKYPVLEIIKAQLYDEGAVYAAMSGSGSSMFGIFEKKPNNDSFADYWTWVAKL